jgi:hypothetical protein
MKRKKLFLITGLMLLFYGCDTFYMICSLNPFYIEKNIILLPQIEGPWTPKAVKPKNDSASSSEWKHADTTSLWTIKRHITKRVVKDKQGVDSTTYQPENFYIARLSNPSDSIDYKFTVVLFRVKDRLYADFIPYDTWDLLKSRLADNSFFKVHTLARITLNNNQVELSWLGADCMKEMIENKRVRVNYQWVKQANEFLLTASPGDLTSMIERYADQPRFINWESQKARLMLTRLN